MFLSSFSCLGIILKLLTNALCFFKYKGTSQSYIVGQVHTSACVCNNYQSDFHGITGGVGLVTEDEQCPLFSKRPSHGEIPQLRADVLHCGSLRHTDNTGEQIPLIPFKSFLHGFNPKASPSRGKTLPHQHFVRGADLFPFRHARQAWPRQPDKLFPSPC